MRWPRTIVLLVVMCALGACGDHDAPEASAPPTPAALCEDTISPWLDTVTAIAQSAQVVGSSGAGTEVFETMHDEAMALGRDALHQSRDEETATALRDLLGHLDVMKDSVLSSSADAELYRSQADVTGAEAVVLARCIVLRNES